MIELIKKILYDKTRRKEFINEFQELVWNEKCKHIDENINEIVSELAYDLDFYEPNETFRNQDSSFYGDERLEEEIQNTLKKLENFNMK